MARNGNVKVEDLGAWDDYANVDAATALPKIFARAKKSSETARKWYWDHIVWKRWASTIARYTSFILLVCGAVFPIAAGTLSEVQSRLVLTQCGVAVLAAAGLVQAGDRIFGWSSGWLRYVSTVTKMESATRKFYLDWADHLLNKDGGVTEDDKRPLFELGKQLEQNISKMQSDETDQWVTEFNASLALLTDLIKSQRESSEKAATEATAAVAARKSTEAEKEKAHHPGAIEVTLVHKDAPAEVKVHVDSDPEETHVGPSWTKLPVSPGLHTVYVTTGGPTSQSVERIVNVPAGGTGKVKIKLP